VERGAACPAPIRSRRSRPPAIAGSCPERCRCTEKQATEKQGKIICDPATAFFRQKSHRVCIAPPRRVEFRALRRGSRY
jgi:hypothetical protein